MKSKSINRRGLRQAQADAEEETQRTAEAFGYPSVRSG